MVLIEAVRDGRTECRVEKPLIVYKEKDVYTDEIYDYLRIAFTKGY